MAAGFLGSFSMLALLLAAVGIYGVMAYSIIQRRKELGIRMALGASRASVLRMVLLQGGKLAGLGVAAGLVLALVGAPLLSSVLFGIEARDPMTFVALPFALVAVSLLASALPALRASRVSPVVVLRYE
jgi:ABC-type antimicrobial peptide transport system permease subunit